jgi:SAM-dependent methyltransferase
LHQQAFDFNTEIDRDRDALCLLRRDIGMIQQKLAAREDEVAALKKWLAGREVAALGQRAASKYNVSGFLDPQDHMLGHFMQTAGMKEGISYYLDGGHADTEKLINLMTSLGLNDKQCRVLEFASGYGRMTRHFTKRFDVTASDIHPPAVEMIKSRLKTPAYVSSHAPDKLPVPGEYDFVFAMSFFSHLPDDTFERWIAALLSLTKPGGYLMFTTHGPQGVKASPELPPLGPDGIGFIPLSEQADLEGHLYGTTTVTPDYVRRKIVSVGGELVTYNETEWWGLRDQHGEWWGLQDQWVVRKPLVNTV